MYWKKMMNLNIISKGKKFSTLIINWSILDERPLRSLTPTKKAYLPKDCCGDLNVI